MTVSPGVLTRVASFSTCEIADALIKLKVPSGGYLPGIELYSPEHMSGPTRICGPAFTVKSDTQAPKPAQHFVRIGSPWLTQVDAAKPNSVLLVSAPAATRSAVWGGLMTARAQSLGVQGVVLDGRCRDLSEHRASRFPVFARGHSVLGQSPFTRPSELEVPLEICDPTVPRGADGTPTFAPVVVHPGDVLLADIDGVVSVPQALAEEVVSLATEGRRVDDLCMADLRAGHGVRETFTKHRGRARQ